MKSNQKFREGAIWRVISMSAVEFLWKFSAFFFPLLRFLLWGHGNVAGAWYLELCYHRPFSAYVALKKEDEWSKIFSDVPAVSECSVVLSLPLPWSQGSRAGLMEVLLEEWLLRPLQSLATIRPVAEFYRLKRKMMDSPFRRETVPVFRAP